MTKKEALALLASNDYNSKGIINILYTDDQDVPEELVKGFYNSFRNHALQELEPFSLACGQQTINMLKEVIQRQYEYEKSK